MRRGSFFPRRSATRSSTDSAAWPNDLARADTRPPVARFVQRRSWGSVGSLRRFAPRRWAAFSRFRDAGPACRSIRACSLPRPFSSGDLRPRHAVHHRCSADAPESRMWPIATSGLRSLRGSDRVSTTLSRPTGRSCLGLRPLAGFRTRLLQLRWAHRVWQQSRNTRGLDTAGDSLAPGPFVTDPSARGFAAPFLRRCVPE
jgi:hypothetical protein